MSHRLNIYIDLYFEIPIGSGYTIYKITRIDSVLNMFIQDIWEEEI